MVKNHEGARHCRKPLSRRKGFNIFITVGFTKTSAFVSLPFIFGIGEALEEAVGFCMDIFCMPNCEAAASKASWPVFSIEST